MGWDGRNWVMDGGDKPKKVNPVENLPDANPQEVAGTVGVGGNPQQVRLNDSASKKQEIHRWMAF